METADPDAACRAILTQVQAMLTAHQDREMVVKLCQCLLDLTRILGDAELDRNAAQLERSLAYACIDNDDTVKGRSPLYQPLDDDLERRWRQPQCGLPLAHR